MANPKASSLKTPERKFASGKKPAASTSQLNLISPKLESGVAAAPPTGSFNTLHESSFSGSSLNASSLNGSSLNGSSLNGSGNASLPASSLPASEDPRQRGLMVGSLCLLLLALSIVVWHERDFWFPDTSEADVEEPAESAPVAKAAPVTTVPVASTATPEAKANHVKRGQRTLASAAVPAAAAPASAPATSASATPAPTNGPIVNRTVLPPLEVEVVAGDSHRTIRPGSNSVRVDLQPGTVPQPAPENTVTANDPNAAKVTTNAADRVQLSAGTSAMVSSSVRPSYPLLARQMKVQGSVILQALISRDGVIQNLKLVSGPRILASAAEDAVRQWRFRPHYEGKEAVETQAKITVNFTISTN